MAKKEYDLVVKTGTYKNAQGDVKNSYMNIGVMMRGDNGPYILLEKTFNPAGIIDDKSSVLVSMYESKPRGASQGRQQTTQQNKSQDFDDEIPF